MIRLKNGVNHIYFTELETVQLKTYEKILQRIQGDWVDDTGGCKCVKKEIVKMVLMFMAATCLCSCTFRSKATLGAEIPEKIIPKEISAISATEPPAPTTGWFENELGK